MRSNSIALLLVVYAFTMFMGMSAVNAQDFYPTEEHLNKFIEASADKWLVDKQLVFKEVFSLKIDGAAKNLFASQLAMRLVEGDSKTVIINSFPGKPFNAENFYSYFYSYTERFSYRALDDALIFQIYLSKKIEKTITISVQAIKMVTLKFGCDTPPCDFKFWCKCFYSG